MPLKSRLTKAAALAALVTAFVAVMSAFAAPGDTVADRVFGQPNLTSNTANNGGISASSLSQPSGVAVDGAGHVYVSDTANNRVLEYDSPLTSQGANRVFGQAGNFTTAIINNGGLSASSLNGPFGVAVDSDGHLYIADSANNRVLEYDNPLSSQLATRVFGQVGSFTTNTGNNGGVNAGSLSNPSALTIDGAGRLYISDQENSRILEFDSPLASQIANRVFGQSGGLTSGGCNSGGASASTLCLPGALVVDSAGRLYIADLWNSRVLEYDSPLTSQSANRVFGQGGNFTTAVINNGGIGASSLNFAFGVMVDAGGHLYIGDTQNDRVLEYDNPLTSQTANRVFGQPNFTSNTANNGGIGPSTLNFPAVLAKDTAGDIYVIDAFNHRVLEYDSPLAPPTSPVVVLVHGYDNNADGTSCDMEPVATYIESPPDMGGKAFKAECLWYRTRAGVVAGANLLKQRVDGTGRDKVDIVAHSMGGLVARYYIEKLGGASKVRSLTMLGTPNWGTAIAIPACDRNWWYMIGGQTDKIDTGACDLVPSSPRIVDLNILPGSHAGVSYQVIAGYIGPPGVLSVPNDCVVEYVSAVGLLFPTNVRAVSHVSPGGPQKWIGCLATGEVDDAGVHQQIAQILLQSNGFAALAVAAPAAPGAAAVATPPPAGPASATIGLSSGVIAQGATFDLPVGMPASQASGTFLFRAPHDPSAMLTFTLLRPGGTPVATTDADVTYESGPGFGGLDETHYIIANPAAGAWTMRVTGTTVPLTGWPYDLQALVPGGIAVSAKAGAGHYDVGQPFALSADVAVNATPYAGATVSATITKPDNTTATLALTDIGGGAYTGSFSATAACGLYQVTITAGGIASGTPFSRQDRTIAFAGVPGNVILNPCVADSDGDGLTDAQEINIYHSNPANPYTAGDGYTDGEHVALAKDPTKYCSIMRADVDHDGAVSILDFVRVAKYFAQTIPPAPARYDQDGDNKISVLDFVKMAQVYTKHVTACP